MGIKDVIIKVIKIFTVIIAIIVLYVSFQVFKEENAVKISYESIAKTVRNKNKKTKKSINFDKLKKINPDIIAWINIPGTPVDYPVVMAKDNNDYYLNHDVKGNYSRYGSIFTDFRLYGYPLRVRNSIIYGHNMGRWTDAMFSSLMDYENHKYYDNHKSVYIYTEKAKTEYEIISVMEVKDSSYVYNLTFESEKEYSDWINMCVSDSMIECDVVDISKVNKIVTLSTCTYDSDKLVIMCAPYCR